VIDADRRATQKVRDGRESCAASDRASSTEHPRRCILEQMENSAPQRVLGIGGIFFKARDPAALGAWYRDNLGVELESWGGAVFRWSGPHNPTATGTTVWSPFPADTRYFSPSESSFMVNYRVADVRAMVAELRAKGVTVDDRIEESEYGVFGWAMDPEGNRLELWQPPEGR
jgi:catechol 2,3-dioxygenase-like lactoylglutathione lyase family enzyme